MLTWDAGRLWAQVEAPTEFRVDVVGAMAGEPEAKVVPWTLEVASPAPDCFPVEADVVLVSRVEPCFSQPELCDGGENFRETDDVGRPTRFGCSDGQDNDDDGLTDGEEPECIGVSGWSFSIVTEECFHLESITTEGTVADFIFNPPGRRDFASFEKSEITIPSFNDDRVGAVASCVLSLTNSVFLEVGAHTVLKLNGSLETAGLAELGSSTSPCGISLIPPGQPGLFGSGEPVPLGITVGSRTALTDLSSTAVSARLSREVRFLRGDSNGDGEIVLSDTLHVFNFLFLGGPRPSCMDAADVDDNAAVELTDGVHLLNYLFLNGNVPPGPGPVACGGDPTPDALGCESVAACPSVQEAPCGVSPIDEESLFCARRIHGFKGGAVVVSDLDFDGHPDVVGGGPGGGVSVLLGDGLGGFTNIQELGGALVGEVEGAVGADLDGDRVEEIVVAGLRLAFFVNLGDGVLVEGGEISDVAFGAVAVGELDGQEPVDVLAISQRGVAHVFTGTGAFGDDAFLARETYPVGGLRFSSVALGDLDGDGDLDFVSALFQEVASAVTIHYNQGDGTFADADRRVVGRFSRGVRMGDFDVDGQLDFMLAHSDADRADFVSTFLGRGDGTFRPPFRMTVDPRRGGCSRRCGGSHATATGDFDQDGFLDFVVFTSVRNRCRVLLGRGDGTFAIRDDLPSGFAALQVAAADFDSDGDLDIVAGAAGLVIFTNCGTP